MVDSKQKIMRARDFGLPDYFDMQAALGHTKHVGGWTATQELAQLCHVQEGQEILYVGWRAHANGRSAEGRWIGRSSGSQMLRIFPSRRIDSMP